MLTQEDIHGQVLVQDIVLPKAYAWAKLAMPSLASKDIMTGFKHIVGDAMNILELS